MKDTFSYIMNIEEFKEMISKYSCKFIQTLEIQLAEQWSIRNFKYEQGRLSNSSGNESETNSVYVFRENNVGIINNYICEMFLTFVILIFISCMYFLIRYFYK